MFGFNRGKVDTPVRIMNACYFLKTHLPLGGG